MFLQAGFNVRFPELIIAPAHGRGRVAARQTELDVVTGIVPASGQIDAAVAVRIQIFLVGVNEFLAHVGADIETLCRRCAAVTLAAVLVGFAAAQALHGNQRDHAVLDMTVAAPGVIAVICHLVAALIGIVETQRQLECLGEVVVVVGIFLVHNSRTDRRDRS